MSSITAIDTEHNTFPLDENALTENKIRYPSFSLSAMPSGGTRMSISLTRIIDEIPLYSEILTRIFRLKENDEVHVYLHTSGGSVLTACALCYAFSQTKAKVVGHASGKVISAGTMVLSFCDDIQVASDAVFLCHISHGMVYAKSSVLRDHGEARSRTMSVFFQKMLERGMLTKDEFVDITEHDIDVYIAGDTMRQRFRDKQGDE